MTPQRRQQQDPLDALSFGGDDPLDALTFAPRVDTLFPPPAPTTPDLPPDFSDVASGSSTRAAPPRRTVLDDLRSAAGLAIRQSPTPFAPIAIALGPSAGEFTKGAVGGIRQQLPRDVGTFMQTVGDLAGP